MEHKKRNKQKDILFILVSSFIVVVAWMAFNLYHIWVTSTVSQHIQLQLTPIDPTFNQQTIQQLETKENVNPLFKQQATASQSVTPTPPSETSPSPSDVPNASESSRFAPTNEPIERLGQ